MAKLLKNAETAQLKKADTKGLKSAQTPQLTKSPTRAKKEKAKYQVKDAENALLLRLKNGDVVIEMFPDEAPNHVERIKALVREGFYNGFKVSSGYRRLYGANRLSFRDRYRRQRQKLKAEFNRRPHLRGTVSMARAMDPDSADSQFFICFAEAPWLNGQYTVWGEVTSGMEYVDMIKRGAGANGAVAMPDEIVSMAVIADL